MAAGINAETRPPVLRTGKAHCGRVKFLNFYVSRSPLRRTVQSDLHIMLLSYYIGMCVFHERQRDMTSVKHNVFLVSGIKTGCLTEKRENIFVH